MNSTSFKGMAATSLIALAAMALSAPAQAGNGNAVGAGLIGLGIGAIVGSALTPREVYVVSPPVYYAPVAYGAPAWTPEWYTYCAQRYRSFDPRTGYFRGYDGLPHLCQ
jgi:BA14K-like protein